MLTLKEINPHNYDVTPEISNNLNILLERMNKVRTVWAKPMIVTSGLRSQADQQRINPKASKSKHLIGAAVDIYDPKGELHDWCKANEELLRGIGLWLENRQGNWQHFQILPFGSYKPTGTIWFNP
jgi:uncharacterized protein YcbK (DUF882 family)